MSIDLPKSVRQIGECRGNRKIYVEDYVMSFARQLAEQAKGTETAAVLLGRTQVHKGVKYLFISGIVEVKGFAERTSDTFSHDIWTGIYTDIKENFTGLEIVGWYYSKAEMPVACTEKLRTIHSKNFGGDKLLFIYEEGEKEEGLFLTRAGVMERQDGYYIYYEKNNEMREYMVAHRGTAVSMENVKDEATQNIRAVLQAKKGFPSVREQKEEEQKAEKQESKYSFGMGAVVVVMALALGFVALRNQSSLSQVENQITTIKETFGAAEKNEPTKTEVETLGSGLSVTKSALSTEPVSGPAASVSPTGSATPKVESTPAPATPAPTTSAPSAKQTSKKSAKKNVKKKAKAASAKVDFWYYTVKEGDTLSEIAQKLFSTTTASERLKDYNNLNSKDEIRAGQKLRIPNL